MHELKSLRRFRSSLANIIGANALLESGTIWMICRNSLLYHPTGPLSNLAIPISAIPSHPPIRLNLIRSYGLQDSPVGQIRLLYC